MSLMVEKLAYLKKLCRLTTEQTAQQAHIPVGTLNKIFSGQTKHPAAEHLDKISRVFRVPIHYLLDDELPTECCFSAAVDDGLFSLSAEEVRFVTQYRRLNVGARHALCSMASLLQAPTGLLAGTIPVKRTLCYTAPTPENRQTSLLRSILIPETEPNVLLADFALLLPDGCMEPIYPPGSVLLCRQGKCGQEDYGVWRLNSKLLLRRAVRRRGVTRLTAPNLCCKDIVVKDGDFLECLGVIIGRAYGYRWE